ncbi:MULTISPECIES: very short patch repair endonuclease [Methylosinus]|uniref:Very short patch repair endonuclease n=1 Tax=Methylosinus trichosporium (strain ATCC 35070 / NCIMB 11131 / UNIQEM 75 / OB3b) TaxID=595536 RepID=A0A2D2CYE9_METT3|nr:MULTISPECIES: very short patch repair endonuclease [Methylosinus]ATQ67772.1 very short patch repair endonuclease [Methylosinus trichosporium OB3b]OBS51791.1 very short patch repair endonuclease [Methylosinus sp. 3S-1]
MKTPKAGDPARSALMKRVRQSRTGAEEAVALGLRRAGLFYRRNCKALPGTPDFANRKRKWAIFVNGCFWHHHKPCPRGTIPKQNRAFWLEKFAANRARDARKAWALRAQGFHVALIWECEAFDLPRLEGRLARLQRRAGRADEE